MLHAPSGPVARARGEDGEEGFARPSRSWPLAAHAGGVFRSQMAPREAEEHQAGQAEPGCRLASLVPSAMQKSRLH